MDNHKFQTNATEETFQDIRYINETIFNLQKQRDNYQENYPIDKAAFEQEFGTLKGEANYYSILSQLIKDFNDIMPTIKIKQVGIGLLKKQLESCTKTNVISNSIFADLSINSGSFLNELLSLRNDLEKTAYDGHYKLFRTINNSFRNLRLTKIFVAIPRRIAIDSRFYSSGAFAY